MSRVHIKQKEDDPNENKRTKQEWNKSFSSSAIQTSTPLSYRPVWDAEKLERTFLEKDKDSFLGKKYNGLLVPIYFFCVFLCLMCISNNLENNKNKGTSSIVKIQG